MDYHIQHGVCFSVAAGTGREPHVTRWTSWGHSDLQQSYLMHTDDGTLMVDPVLPKTSEALRALKDRAGKVAAIISLSPLHERNIAEAAKRYRAPVYGPESAKKTTKYGKKLGLRYDEGDDLPGGVQSVFSGDASGEMWLHWSTPGGQAVLINADTIYGQNRLGGLGGRSASYWMQEGGIRLRATGSIKRREFQTRYSRIDRMEVDLVLNGHNPLPLDEDPKTAIANVLAKGSYEVHPSGVCTFMYLDFADST